jgi:hypothetical protein
VVEEDGSNVVGAPADIGLPLDEEPFRPRRGRHGLPPAHRIGRGLIRVSPLGFARLRVMEEDREELVADDGPHAAVEGLEAGLGLVRLPHRARHGFEVGQRIDVRLSAHGRCGDRVELRGRECGRGVREECPRA